MNTYSFLIITIIIFPLVEQSDVQFDEHWVFLWLAGELSVAESVMMGYCTLFFCTPLSRKIPSSLEINLKMSLDSPPLPACPETP